MATRSGKNNSVASKTGAYSPCGALFRNAGLGSVWDWGDLADEPEPSRSAVAFVADCRLSVSVSASVGVDVALAVSGLRITAFDLRSLVTRLTDILCDEELIVTEQLDFQRDYDQETVVTSTAELRSDERIVATEVRIRSFDVNAVVTNLFSKGSDTLFLVSGIDPELFAADTRIATSGALCANADLRLAISGAVERLADAGIVMFGMAERLVDLRSIIGGDIGLDTDISAVIPNVGSVEYDMRLAIVGEMVFLADTVARILRRMTPDADMAQKIYILLIRESHTIQV